MSEKHENEVKPGPQYFKLYLNGKHVGFETLVLRGEPPNDRFVRETFVPGESTLDGIAGGNRMIPHNKRQEWCGFEDHGGHLIFFGDRIRADRMNRDGTVLYHVSGQVKLEWHESDDMSQSVVLANAKAHMQEKSGTSIKPYETCTLEGFFDNKNFEVYLVDEEES